MSGGQFVCFVEGKSDKEMLKGIIPRLTGLKNDRIEIYDLRGKPSLLARVGDLLRGYETSENVFLVMCDKDREDCMSLKKEIQRAVGKHKAERTRVRIACHELESFYLGDLQAVEQGLGLPNLSEMQDRYVTPDSCVLKPENELVLLSQNRYRKTDGSRNIAPFLSLKGDNKSHSFNVLVDAIKQLHQIMQSNANS